MLYYSYPQIVVEEVPDEISLALSISGCSINCPGCHSMETWNPSFGEPINPTVLNTLINKHKHISCVLFYGGEWNVPEMIKLFEVCKDANLKICLYTGEEFENVATALIEYLDSIKVGPYIKELGGIQSPITNQRYIKLPKV